MQEEPATFTQSRWGRYAELRPDDLADIRQDYPVAYLPWGALDWHGPHMPIGVDGIVAEAITEQVVQRTGGVLFPATWWPGSSTAQRQTLSVRSSVVRALWDDLFYILAMTGWRIAVVISGYYAKDHELALMDAAEQAIKQHGLLVLVLPPLSLIDESLLDHAGLWETSLLLSLRPELVDMYALGDEELTPSRSAVQGRDPRGAASPSLGDTVIRLAVERIVAAVLDLMSNGDPSPLLALYEQRRERYTSVEESKASEK